MTSSKIHDKNEVVKGANKIIGGPSIRLYCLNLKYSYNLYIIIIIIIVIIIIIIIIIFFFLLFTHIKLHKYFYQLKKKL